MARALIRRAPIEARTRGSHPDDRVRGTPSVLPDATLLACRRMVTLCGRHLERPRRSPATHLDDVRLFAVHRCHTKEGVATDVHESAALTEVGLERVKHRRRPVLVV